MDVKDKIFDFAYEMAMRDATLQKAYYAPDKNIDKRSLLKCEEARDSVKEYIKCILENETPNFYDTEEEVEKHLAKYCNKENYPVFTFGNAQKLINMTAKYMYIACYYKPELSKSFENCHCPMDSRIIEIIIKQVEEYGTEAEEKAKELADEQMKTDGVSMTWRAYLRQSWSGIGKEDKEKIGQYKFFQKLVKYLGERQEQELSPLEFDYCFWE